MRRPRPSQPPGRLRRLFRICRRCLLFGTLGLVLLLFWMHHFGLPAPLSALVRAKLRKAGWTADYARVRLRFDRGLVADGLSLTRAGTGGFRLRVEEVVLEPDWRRLLEGDFEVAALNVLSGRLVVPLNSPTTGPVAPLVLDDLAGHLRRLPGEEWEISGGRARLFGCDVQLDGRVSHLASLNRFRPRPPPGTPPTEPPLRAQLRQLTTWWRQLALEPAPRVRLWFRGDATDPGAFLAEVNFHAPAAQTPWGNARGLDLNARLNAAPPTNRYYHLRLQLRADRLQNEQFGLEGCRLTANLAQPSTNPVPESVLWQLEADRFRWRTATLSNVTLNASTVRTDDRFRQWKARFELVTDGLATPEFRAGANRISGSVAINLDQLTQTRGKLNLQIANVTAGELGQVRALHAAAEIRPADRAATNATVAPSSWGFWTNAAPWAGSLSLRLQGVDSPRLRVEALELDGDWTPPELRLSRLFARLYDGVLDLSDARLDVASRELEVALLSTFDVHGLDRLLPAKTARWLEQFTWERPPTASGRIRVVLPPWTGPAPDPRTHLLPTLAVDGHVTSQNAAYRGVPFESAKLDLSVKDGVLRLRNFHLRRLEGEADLAYTLEILPRNFHWQLDARLNPVEAAPALGREVVTIFRLFDFTNAAHVRGDVMGCFLPPRRTDLALRVEATDFGFRGERYDAVSGTLVITNRILTATDAVVRRGVEWARVERLDYALEARELTLTNAHTRMDPMRVARAIGPAVEQVLAPYQFAEAPEIRINGFVPTDGRTGAARMEFEVAGGPFHFWRFNFADVAGRVRWLGDTVRITNFNGGFYGGRLTGHLTARLSAEQGPNLSFEATATNASLRPIVRDLFAVTNRLAGLLSGHVVVTNGIPDTLDTWFGYGDLALRDGLIWDLPVFGVVSKALNAVSPGLGNNQATAARGHYTLTRGVLHSNDFKIETGAARLDYEGACSLAGETDARVRVELMRNTPVVGPLVSLLFAPLAKVLELHVTGLLSDPDVKLLHMSPFADPFRDPMGTLKTIFQPRPLPGNGSGNGAEKPAGAGEEKPAG